MRGAGVTMVFQEPMTSLNPLHTIERQIGEIIALHGGRAASTRDRVIELLTEVGLADPASRLGAYPHQLSGGQRQRVMIAMALANRPDLFIADEPTTALDVTVQAQILALLKDLQAKLGMALLFITHDLGIVRKIASDVAVMQKGKIVEAGKTAEVFANPQHPYTKMLLAAEPKGEAPARDCGGEADRRGEGRARLVPDPPRLPAPHGRPREGGRRRVADGARGPDGRRRRRIRLGQDDARPGDPAPDPLARDDRLLRPRPRAACRSEQMRPFRRDMQIVFQDPFGSLSPRLSVAEIVEEGLIAQKTRLNAAERREAVARALADTGVDPASMDRYPHEFSGGQRQRIAIARAMALDPKFVVLDEPTSALDMSVQAQIVDLLRDLQKRRALAYLFISHDLKVVRALASEIVVMRRGEVVESGPAREVFAAPRSDYTRALFAAAFAMEADASGVVSQ